MRMSTIIIECWIWGGIAFTLGYMAWEKIRA